ncbi:Acetyltransferase (GNAT) family protein [Agromyces sp. CF514]|uniref:GNAT family N-acetyltransferase n=1 Tax=Agromyces sp. CF514 TaxID=1881031 RepID=UPI0008E80B65|nr:GNAT family N-acetyltransferase [Agromyces sp. CF514]SFR71160.1 Acetyltransferase (GNAT) family protein [Agromyces sp. CF514]
MTVPAGTIQPYDIRHLTGPEEIDFFSGIPYALNHELADDLDGGRRRPPWAWLAVRDDHLLGRLALWAPAGAATPSQLDLFDVEPSLSEHEQRDIGTALLEAAHAEVLAALDTPPEVALYLPPDWREHPATRQATELRLELLEQAGARFIVERLRLHWTPADGIPQPDERLSFRPFDSDDEFLDLTARVLPGTLDAHSRGELVGSTPQAVAREQFDDEFVHYTSPREWWRVATDADGHPLGFVVPARNAYNHIVAYIGVLPEHRGNGYIDGILAEGTRVLAEAGAPHIRAQTDVGNIPMADAFARGGYATIERLVNLAWE